MYEIINNVLGIFILYVIPFISLYILYNNKNNENRNGRLLHSIRQSKVTICRGLPEINI